MVAVDVVDSVMVDSVVVDSVVVVHNPCGHVQM